MKHLLLLFALIVAGCGPELDPLFQSVDKFVIASDAVVWRSYQRDLAGCKIDPACSTDCKTDPVCVDRVRADYNDVSEASDALHTVICNTNPKAKGCGQ